MHSKLGIEILQRTVMGTAEYVRRIPRCFLLDRALAHPRGRSCPIQCRKPRGVRSVAVPCRPHCMSHSDPVKHNSIIDQIGSRQSVAFPEALCGRRISTTVVVVVVAAAHLWQLRSVNLGRWSVHWLSTRGEPLWHQRLFSDCQRMNLRGVRLTNLQGTRDLSVRWAEGPDGLARSLRQNL
jgi:hypothetical protein